MGVGLKDVAENCNSRDFGKWVQERRRQIKTQEHVTALNRGEPGNAGTVESHALGQESLVDTGQGNRHMMQATEQVGEFQVDLNNLVFSRVVQKLLKRLHFSTSREAAGPDLVRGAVLACHEVRRYRILPGNQGSHVNVRELAVLDENSAIDHVETYLLGVAHDRCREGVVQSAGELESVEVPHDQIGRLPYLDTADV